MATPFNCNSCPQQFKRSEHLKRHTNIHTNQTKYQCDCGIVFARPEVLGRHLRSCPAAQSRQLDDPSKKLLKRTRSKKACDKCASMKLKCDTQQPCRRCGSKSIECKYTRGGYTDRYEAYRVKSDDGHLLNTNTFDSSMPASPLQQPCGKVLPNADQRAHKMRTAPDERLRSTSGTLPDSQVANVGSECFPNNAVCSTDSFELAPALPNLDLGLGNNLSPPFDSDPWFFVPFIDLNPIDMLDLTEDQPPMSNQISRTDPHKRGFSLEQSDPVEAKCSEVRALLQQGGQLYTEAVAVLSTRDKMLQCHKLYGAHFQYHYPLIHVPTHKLVEAPPVLLSAMMLAGALYSKDPQLTPYVSRIGLQLLLTILNDPVEMNLGRPDIPTVQACLILCLLLGLSRDSMANQSWLLVFPRIQSMAERLGAFKTEDLIVDDSLTLEAFDWASWIRQESLRRIACQIFCHDVGGCIMIRRPPSLLPLSVHVTLPSYECAWEAGTATECLQNLQNLPRQTTISGALKALLKRPFEGYNPTSEISGYGMFVLIHAIHGMVFQLTREELAPFVASDDSGMNVGSFSSTEASILMERLQTDLSGSTVEAVTEVIVNACSNTAFQRLNLALDAWRTSWNNRKFRDHFSDNRSFSASPVPYWVLAKLFIALHLLATVCAKPDNLQLCSSPISYSDSAIRSQDRIMSWLQKFKSESREMASEAGAETSEGNAMSDESHVLTMMKPL